MGQASRAIIINSANELLVMRRNKQGRDYYTLIGGRVNEGETPQQALIREVKEETGLDLVAAQLMFTEKHPEPYNEQFHFLCEAANYDAVGLQHASEEAIMNKEGINVHEPMWVSSELFGRLAFLTNPLQKAIVEALKKGFPPEPVAL